MKISMVAMAMALVLCGQGALAATRPLQLEEIRVQQQQIRQEMLEGGPRYKAMTETKKMEVLAKQDRLLRLIGDKQDPADLNDSQRVEAFNLLEWIEAAVNNEESERMVCNRERATGSNRVVRVCKTQRQMEEERLRARRQMLEGTMPAHI